MKTTVLAAVLLAGGIVLFGCVFTPTPLEPRACASAYGQCLVSAQQRCAPAQACYVQCQADYNACTSLLNQPCFAQWQQCRAQSLSRDAAAERTPCPATGCPAPRDCDAEYRACAVLPFFPTATPNPSGYACGWCGGSNCKRLTPGDLMSCPGTVSPSDKQCVEQNGQCVIIPRPAPTAYPCVWCGTRCAFQTPGTYCPGTPTPTDTACVVQHRANGPDECQVTYPPGTNS